MAEEKLMLMKTCRVQFICFDAAAAFSLQCHCCLWQRMVMMMKTCGVQIFKHFFNFNPYSILQCPAFTLHLKKEGKEDVVLVVNNVNSCD